MKWWLRTESKGHFRLCEEGKGEVTDHHWFAVMKSSRCDMEPELSKVQYLVN